MRGGGGFAGSQTVHPQNVQLHNVKLQNNEYSCEHGAQIYFGDPTSYFNLCFHPADDHVTNVSFVCYAVVDPVVADVSEAVCDPAFSCKSVVADVL